MGKRLKKPARHFIKEFQHIFQVYQKRASWLLLSSAIIAGLRVIVYEDSYKP